MLVKHSADYRTLLWAFVLVPGVAVAHYLRPDLAWYLFPASMYFSVSCAVIAHNHMHAPTMKSKAANKFFSAWISVFYGYPVFVWMPTHNLNHHRHLNKHGDATITWRHTNKHNGLVAATYFFVSSYHQGRWIKDFINQAKARNPTMYRRIISQYVVCYGTHVILAGLSIWHFGLGQGMFHYALAFGVPGFFALWTVMLFNYMQHVHTDPWSKRNHSRNFTSWLTNFMLFGNGFHTVHHDNANLHWAEAAKAHAAIASEIDPRLSTRSMWFFLFKQYLLALFIPSLGTVQVGRAPFDLQDEEKLADAPEALDMAPKGTLDTAAQI